MVFSTITRAISSSARASAPTLTNNSLSLATVSRSQPRRYAKKATVVLAATITTGLFAEIVSEINPGGQLTARISTHGATITHLIFKDKDGVARDLLQGFDTLEEQLACDKGLNPYYGTIGRFCNRIKQGKFKLNDETYSLPVNNGPNSLHGGLIGFDKREWKLAETTGSTAVLHLLAHDGEEGYPADLEVTVTYRLIDPAEIRIEYRGRLKDTGEARSTILNMTTHSYFNLSGARTSIRGHRLWLPGALGYMELDSTQIPTGRRVLPLKGDPMDFITGPKEVGRDLDKVTEFKGYDHFYVVRDAAGAKKREVKRAALTECDETGIRMELYTDAMGVQLYTGNWLDGSIGPKKSTQVDGKPYAQYTGMCLEASAPPDAINSPDPAIRDEVVLRPGESWDQINSYRFSLF